MTLLPAAFGDEGHEAAHEHGIQLVARLVDRGDEVLVGELIRSAGDGEFYSSPR
jgi:hypothetical protein